VELDAVLTPERPLTDDEITDIIEAVIDELDTVGGEDPSISTTRTGSTVAFVIGVGVTAAGEWEAMDAAAVLIRQAFGAAAVDAEHLVPAGLRLLTPA